MTFANVVPILRESRTPRRTWEEESSFFAVPRLMSRMLDEFYRDFVPTPFRSMAESLETYSPRIDVKDTEKDIHVLAELPGVDEKDIELSIANNVLTIKGEKITVSSENKFLVTSYSRSGLIRPFCDPRRIFTFVCIPLLSAVSRPVKNPMIEATMITPMSPKILDIICYNPSRFYR